jgi:hypothetical protein
LAGDTAKQKGFHFFNASLIVGATAIKRFRSSSRRPAYRQGVFDPIAVSRLRGRSRYGAAKARLDQKKPPLSDLCGSAVNLILKGANAIAVGEKSEYSRHRRIRTHPTNQKVDGGLAYGSRQGHR